MKKWNLIIDVALCHDCNNCFLADKDEFVGNDWPPYSAAQPWSGHRWMNIFRKERGQFPLVQVAYLPMPCMHCDQAPCLTPDEAVYKRPDGLVIIDPVKAKGRPEIVDTCPYGAIYWNDDLDLPQKCTGCVHLLEEGWTETRCSRCVPPEPSSSYGPAMKRWRTAGAAEGLEAFRADLGTKPRVYYKNLHRWTKVLVAGSVAYLDTDECAEGATISVRSNGTSTGEPWSSITASSSSIDWSRRDLPDCHRSPGLPAPFCSTVTLDQSLTMELVMLEKA